MAKLIWWNLLTLDGRFEGPDHDLSWHLDVWGDELEQLAIEQHKTAGALVFGRLTYQLMANHWPGQTGDIADFMNAVPKVVFSRSLTHAEWHNTRVFGSDVPQAVARLKQDVAKDIYVFGSANLADSLLRHGLFDEFRIGLTPHVLGQGAPMFKSHPERLKLRLLDAKPMSSGIVILRYVPAK